jgi:hypothetical protein
MFVELKLRDDAPTELMRPLARQDFVNLGISFVNFEDFTQLQSARWGKEHLWPGNLLASRNLLLKVCNELCRRTRL